MEFYDCYVMDWMGMAMTDREGELLLPEELRVMYVRKSFRREKRARERMRVSERERERDQNSPFAM